MPINIFWLNAYNACMYILLYLLTCQLTDYFLHSMTIVFLLFKIKLKFYMLSIKQDKLKLKSLEYIF